MGQKNSKTIKDVTDLTDLTYDKNERKKRLADQRELLQCIYNNVIGKDAVFVGPYGKKQVVYCDYTASGRPLQYIEDYIRNHVYELYANTHTTANVTGRSTQRLREEARHIVKCCVNASDQDVVIFTGNGVTGAVHKLIGVMDIARDKSKTVVLTSPYEHHSNILPWKETGAKVVRIAETKRGGQVDLEDLKRQLVIHKMEKYKIIATFSAASNITGIISNTATVSELVHKHGGMIFWDYATAGPYLKIDMNESETAYKDAIFLSPHKFVGGPGTPGILVAKRTLFTNAVPHCGGGGTVSYVTRDTHRYISNIEEREEGGTPAIVEAIRAGLVFQLKLKLDPHFINIREEEIVRRAMKVWKQNKNLMILGSQSAKRIPIYSFLIKHQASNQLLHYNFVAAILNDLFGIQSRGGCACAGPYAEDLLGISEPVAKKFFYFLTPPEERNPGENIGVMEKNEIEDTMEVMKPGFTRLNLPYFATDDVIDYIINAVDLVATHGWTLLAQYTFDSHTGAWKHREGKTEGELSLHDVSFKKTGNKNLVGHVSMHKMMATAMTVFNKAKVVSQKMDTSDTDLRKHIPSEFENLVWFLLPTDAQKFLLIEEFPFVKSPSVKKQVPFSPRMSISSTRSSSRRSRKNSYKVVTTSPTIFEEDENEPELKNVDKNLNDTYKQRVT